MSATVDAAALLDELEAGLDAGGEAIAIVERATCRILWCTACCRDVHPSLRSGGSVAGIAAIERTLDGASAGRAAEPLAIVPPGGSGEPDRGHGETPFHVLAAHAGSDRVTLRFTRDVRADDYLHRYVADREQLFMVSRTVSVSEMATTLAHELNQPIGTIANLLQGLHVLLARERGEVPEPIRRALARASDQTRFAAGIITRIRSFTQSRTPRLVACEAGRLVAETVELLDWVFLAEGVRVDLRAGEAPLLVSGDEILLRQVFVNLLRNAVDAMRERPRDARRIHVLVERRAESVVVEISDTGEGLGDGAEDTLFVPFLSTKGDGMGVGLNICRSFVEMHRGKLWLTPAAGGGCTAHVTLPARVPDARAGAPSRDGKGVADGVAGDRRGAADGVAKRVGAGVGVGAEMRRAMQHRAGDSAGDGAGAAIRSGERGP